MDVVTRGQQHVDIGMCYLLAAKRPSNMLVYLCCNRPPRWPSGKASASRAEGPGFESR